MAVINHKCLCCGAPLRFDPETQQMVCDSCSNKFDVETLNEYDRAAEKEGDSVESSWEEYNAATGSGDWSDEDRENMCIYECGHCGAEIIAGVNEGSTKCLYCGFNAVIAKQFSGVFKPDYIIPFKLDKQDAEEAFKNHCSKKILLPKMFRSENKVREITGIYVPFWLYDGDVDADITFRGERVTTWRSGDYRYTKTDHYMFRRAGDVSFHFVPVDGSSRIDDTLMESIEPYDQQDGRDFSTAYFAGFAAEKYDVDANECKPRANERIKNSTVKMFEDTISGYTAVRPQSTSVNITNGNIRYVLMPVWLLNTQYKEKTYTFAMNGQTGKFIGDLPMSTGKFLAWFLGLGAAISAAAFFIMQGVM